MKRNTSILLAAIMGVAAIATTSTVHAQNVFTLAPNMLKNMSQDLSQPDDVETQPDGKGGIQVTLTYDDSPGATGSSEGDLVLSTWNGAAGVGYLGVSNFTNYELQFTNIDPNGGVYVQPVLQMGPNWFWVQGSPSNGGDGSVGNYNDSSNPSNGAASFLMNWDISTATGSTQDPNWATDSTSVNSIRLAFFTPNGIVPPSGGALFDIDPVPMVPGDTNGDGKVNSTDEATIIANMGKSVQYGDYTVGDLNEDGVVNADDQALFDYDAAIYNSGLNTVPEPAMISLLGMAGLLVVRRRRRD